MNSTENFFNKLILTIDRLPDLVRKFRNNYQNRIITFLIFVFIAFVFWFIRALNERYEAEIYYPVKYTHLPENKILVEKLPDKLKLNVEAPGLKIFLRQLHLNVKVLRFNVESYSKYEAGNNSFYILTRQVKEFITEDLEGVRILNISPDTIFFHFVDVISKKIPVKVLLKNPNMLLAKQFKLNVKIYTEPDSLIVSGPSFLLDTLKFIHTTFIDVKNLNDTLQKSFPLQQYDQLKLSQQKIKVIIPVDKFTESSISSTIAVINVPDSLSLITFPGTTTITYQIALSNYEKVNPDLLIPFVDYSDVINNIEKRLKVGLIDTPEWINNVRISPDKIEYIIEK